MARGGSVVAREPPAWLQPYANSSQATTTLFLSLCLLSLRVLLYLIRIPEIALEITKRWISLVPSKMV